MHRGFPYVTGRLRWLSLAFLLVTINAALPILGIPEFWQNAVVGALILGSISLDRVLSLRRAHKLIESRDET